MHVLKPIYQSQKPRIEMSQSIAITVDAVIFTKHKQQQHILLIKRKNEPYKGHWALPGGFLEQDETLQNGAIRELEEETGLGLKKLVRLGVFDEPDHDPRGRTISVAFTGQLSGLKKIKGADDAAKAEWVSVDTILELAFDHRKIIEEAQLFWQAG